MYLMNFDYVLIKPLRMTRLDYLSTCVALGSGLAFISRLCLWFY